MNDDCVYVMHVISLKDIQAEDIFNRIEGKKYNQISDEDIAALQLIVYTDYDGTALDILKKAYGIVEKLEIDNQNEKEAIWYILNVLSANMLDDDEYNEFLEETTMILNPRDRYFNRKGANEKNLEVANKLYKDNVPIEKIKRATGLSEEEIINGK